jgi:glycosyltransferase involved in cell wall biosynthesis
MNVLALRADTFGCGHYRISLPAAHAGVSVTIEDRLPLQTVQDGWKRALINVPIDADVVVIQRPLSHHIPAIIERLQSQGVAVVVEIDDDLTSLDPTHVSYRKIHPTDVPYANWQHLRTCCRAADLVTVTTPALAQRFGGHGRVAVLPNCVSEDLLQIQTNWNADLGWTGWVGTHPRDLDVLGRAIRQLVEDGFSFRVIGPGDGAERALGLPCVDDTGWLDLPFYYRAAAQLRVGIVPLADTAFNRAKSNLKGIEYAALGVPFVASPTPEYFDLMHRGAGVIATKPRRWARLLRGMLSSERARTELAQSGRDVVQAHYTIEEQGWKWAEAWERAIRYRKAHPGARAA